MNCYFMLFPFISRGMNIYIYIFFMLIIKNSLHCLQARRLNEVAKDKDAELSLSQRLDDGWLDG